MDSKRKSAIHSSMYHQCRERGYATTVDVLMDIGVLQKSSYLDWRNGKIPFLEKVCEGNLHKLSEIRKEMRSYASAQGLKPSVTVYKRWGLKKKNGQGRKPVIQLRFSKSGAPGIEQQYSTHYVDSKRIVEIKASRSAVTVQQRQNSSFTVQDEFSDHNDACE